MICHKSFAQIQGKITDEFSNIHGNFTDLIPLLYDISVPMSYQ